MGSRTNGYTSLCCYLEGNDADYFVNKYVEYNPDEFEENEIEPEDREDEMYMWLSCNEKFRSSTNRDDFYASLLSEETYHSPMCFVSINGTGETKYTPLIIIHADKGLETASILEGRFYKSKDELIQEFKDKLEKYLPENFNWESHIGDLDIAITC